MWILLKGGSFCLGSYLRKDYPYSRPVKKIGHVTREEYIDHLPQHCDVAGLLRQPGVSLFGYNGQCISHQDHIANLEWRPRRKRLHKAWLATSSYLI